MQPATDNYSEIKPEIQQHYETKRNNAESLR
jgi:hypothetical protein